MTATDVLAREWDSLYAQEQIPTEWQIIAPEIRDMESLEDLVDAMDQGGPFADDDTIWLAMITRAQDGDDLAGHVLLRSLRMRCHGLGRTAAWRGLDKPLAAAQAAAWIAIATYPLTRRTKVRSNLFMETLHHMPDADPVRSRRREQGRECLFASPTAADAVLAGERQPSAAEEIVDLLLWALDSEIITREEGALLYRCSVEAERSPRMELTAIAAENGVSDRWMRELHSRAVHKISAAVQRA